MSNKPSRPPHPELVSLLRGWAGNPIPGAWRAAVADWLAEHPDCQRTRVATDELPTGFNQFWHDHGFGLTRHVPHTGQRGRWSRHEIAHSLRNTRPRSDTEPGRWGYDWYDHGGATVVGGIPCVVGEPYTSDDELEPMAAAVQAAYPTCPVSYDFAAYHFTHCRRIALWFTFATAPPPKPVRCRVCRYRRHSNFADPHGRCEECATRWEPVGRGRWGYVGVGAPPRPW